MSGPLIASYVVLWILFVVLSVVVLAMVRQIGLLHRRIEPFGARIGQPGPDIGAEVPPFDHVDLTGRRISLGSERGRKTLMVFVSPTCSSCKDLAPAIRSIARSERGSMDTILVSDGSDEAVRRFVDDHKLRRLPMVTASDTLEQYGVHSTPYALLIDASGHVETKGIVNSLEQLASLVNAGSLGTDSVESYVESLPRQELDPAFLGDARLNGGKE